MASVKVEHFLPDTPDRLNGGVILRHEEHIEPRWCAEVDYRMDAGIVTAVHQFDEIEELHDIIERGPNFYTIEKIVIYPQGEMADDKLTIEQAERQ